MPLQDTDPTPSFGGFGFREKLNEQQVDAILAYIKTWWTEEQRKGQADISQRYQEALDRQKQDR